MIPKSKIYYMKLFFMAFLVLNCEKSSLNFSNGIKAVEFDIQKDGIENMKDSASCKTCHQTVYENWNLSRHKVSFTNELYKESHDREPRNWCVNCHAPFIKPNGDESNLEDRILKEEGISCIVCHVREKKILTQKLPKKTEDLVHTYKVEKDFGDRNFCASCHQFNFPNIESSRQDKNFIYSNLEMQNTVNEFNSSFFSKMGECKTCHMESYSMNSHSFFGGHSKKKLDESIEIEIERISDKKIMIKLISIGIAHSFPTGDLFRTLRIRLNDFKSKKFITEINLKKQYENNKSKDKNSPSMNLVSDNRIQPPLDSHISEKNFILEIKKGITELEVVLFMDYLFGLNRLETKLDKKFTYLEFKRKKIRIKDSKLKG